MTTTQATAEVFLTALQALPKKERDAVLAGIADNEELREELLDLVETSPGRGERQ